MALDNNTNQNHETFWLDGIPFKGIKNTILHDTGTEKYWIDGAPVQEIYSKSNYDTGKLMDFFE